MDALTFLSQHVPLFAGLGEAALEPLAVGATIRKLAPGQAVLHAGVSVEFVHVLASGSASVHARVPGKGVAQIATLSPGEVFGEISVLDKSLAGATVKAGEGGAYVLLIPEAPFRALIDGNEEFAGRVHALVAARRSAPSKSAAA